MNGIYNIPSDALTREQVVEMFGEEAFARLEREDYEVGPGVYDEDEDVPFFASVTARLIAGDDVGEMRKIIACVLIDKTALAEAEAAGDLGNLDWENIRYYRVDYPGNGD